MRRLPLLPGLLLAVLAVGLGAPAASGSGDIVTTRLEWEPGLLGSTTANKVPFKETPPKDALPLAGLTNARYSRIVMAGTKGLLIALDANPESPRLWVDHDFDGDLTDEKRVWLKAQGTAFTRTQVVLVTYPGDESRTRAELRFSYNPTSEIDHVTVYPLLHRRGTVVLGGRLRLVALTDGSSDLRFNDPKRDKLYVDLDGDGRFATTGDAPERVTPGVPFRVGEEGWIAEVTDISGRAVTFTRASEVPPAKPRTWPSRGTPSAGVRRAAPDESFDDLKRKYKDEQDKAYTDRYQTINLIGYVGTPDALKLLRRIVDKDSDNNIQAAAVRAMGNVAYVEQAGPLLEEWATGGQPHLQSAAVQALYYAGHPNRGAVYRRLLDSGPKTILSSACQYLAYERTEAVEKLLLAAFRSRGEAMERYYVYIGGLRNLAGGPPLTAMLEAVDEDYATLRAEAVKDLQVLGHPKARDVALALAQERPVVVAVGLAVAQVLGAAGDPESVGALLAMFEEETLHANVKKAVLDQLRFLRSPESIAVLLKSLKSKTATTRQAVAEILASIAEPDVTQALLAQSKREKDPLALAAVLEALGDHGDSAAIPALLKRAKKRASKDPMKAAVRASAIRALARIGFGHEEVRKYFLGLLDAARWEDRVLAVDAAGASGDARFAGAVARHLDDDSWQLRLSAIEALDALRCKSAIGPLIARLETEEEERLRDAIADALFRLTGQNFYDDARVWKAWWAENGPAFEMPEEIPERIDSDVGGTGAGFYGIPVKTERVVFVIDQSGSMSASGRKPDEDDEEKEPQNRLDVAVTEVLGAIGRLKNKAKVNVILFHTSIHPWKDQLTPLGGKSRAALKRHLESKNPTGGTNLYDGLELALMTSGVDTVFLLSDGVPGAGKYIATKDILTAVRRINQTRRVAIHCVSIGMPSDLLKRLAEENGGRYAER